MFGLIEVVQKPIVLQILVVPDLSKWRECCSSCSLHCLIRSDRPKHYRTSTEEVGMGRLRTRGSSLNASQLIVPRQLFGTMCHSPEFFQFQMFLAITGRSMKILQNDLSTHFHLHPFIHTTFGLYLRPRPWRLKPPAGVWPLITALQAIGRSELRRSQSWQAGNLEVDVMVKTRHKPMIKLLPGSPNNQFFKWMFGDFQPFPM